MRFSHISSSAYYVASRLFVPPDHPLLSSDFHEPPKADRVGLFTSFPVKRVLTLVLSFLFTSDNMQKTVFATRRRTAKAVARSSWRADAATPRSTARYTLDPACYDLMASTPAGEVKGLLSHDLDGKLQFNRVGREVNAAAINKLPNDHSRLVGRINRL